MKRLYRLLLLVCAALQAVLPGRRLVSWLIGAASCVVLLAWSLPQPVPDVIGSHLELHGQVSAPSNSATLNSTYAVSGNDEILWTSYFQSRHTEPYVLQGEQTLPSDHVWRAGHVRAPPGAVLEYNVGGSWQLVEPADGASVSAVRWSLSPMLQIKSGNVIPLMDFSGTGDGFRIIPYKNRFYVVNHHYNFRVLNCRVTSTGNPCPGFPDDGGGLSLAGTAGTPLVADAGVNPFYAPNVPLEALNYATGEMFVGVVDTTDGIVKIVCTDLDTLTSCGTFSLGPGDWVNEPHTNLDQVGNKYFVLRSTGDLHCFDIVAKTGCGSYAYPPMNVNLPSSSGPSSMTSVVMNGKILFADSYHVWCHDTATNAPCTGWTSTGFTSSSGALPVLNTDGSPKGVCNYKATYCYTLGGSAFTPSANLFDYLTNNSFWPAGTWDVAVMINVGGVLGTRIYTGPNDSWGINCFDFATDAICSGYPKKRDVQGLFYTTRIDATRPGCLLSIGDWAKAVVMDAVSGEPCKDEADVLVPHTLDAAPVDYLQCDSSQALVRAWDKVRVTPAMSWGGSTGLSRIRVTLKDKDGVQLPTGLNPVRDFTAGSFSLDISDIPYTTYPRLKVTVQMSGGSGGLATTGDVGIDVTWQGDPMQVCMQTRAPNPADCQTTSTTVVRTWLPGDAASTYRETLSATKVFGVGAGTGGQAAGASVATTARALGNSLASGEERSYVLQGRFDPASFAGDLWGFQVSQSGQISASSLTKASSLTPAASARTMYLGQPDSSGVTGAQQIVGLSYANATTAQKSALGINLSGAADALGSARLDHLRGTGAAGLRSVPAGRLGPVINSGPMVLPMHPLAGLAEVNHPGYSAYRSSSPRSAPLVLWGGNDAALHAASVGSTGISEVWSFVPDVMLRRASAYTDPDLAGIWRHPHFIDNVPMIGHANLGSGSSSWGAVAVLTYGRGARALTILDITQTNLSAGTGAVEYTNTTPGDLDGDGLPDLADLGYIVSAPIWSETAGSQQIVKMPDGRWAVLVGNGINSNDGSGGLASSGPGRAVLYAFYLDRQAPRWRRYAVDALFSTTATEKATLQMGNGLSTPRPLDLDGDGKIDLVYAGDLQGSLWRFDLRGGSGSPTLSRLYRSPAGQPIHGAPLLLRNPSGQGCSTTTGCWQVVFGTGEYQSPLVSSSNQSTQYLIGLLDKGSAASVNHGSLTAQTLASAFGTSGVEFRFTQKAPPDYGASGIGWVIALGSGEHLSGAPRLASNGQVLFSVVKPVTAGSSATTCSAARTWLFQTSPLSGVPSADTFDYNNDGSVSAADRAKIGDLTVAAPPAAMAIAGAQFNAPSVLLDYGSASGSASLILPGLAQTASADGASFSGPVNNSSTPQTPRQSATLRTGDSKSLGRLSWRQVQ